MALFIATFFFKWFAYGAFEELLEAGGSLRRAA